MAKPAPEHGRRLPRGRRCKGLEFKLVEREPKCLNDDGLYPWDDCSHIQER